MPLSIFLVLEVFSLILTPGEAVVYYVTPTEPPNPDCPGQPCQTLDYYFSHKEEYFNSSKMNVTMLVLGGRHILSLNHTDKSYCRKSYAHIIKDLEMFEMIGLEPARDVVIQLLPDILLTNITKSYFASLTFSNAAANQTTLNLVGCLKTAPADNVTFVTVVNGTIFNGISIFQFATPSVNFNTTVANSRFDNQTWLEVFSQASSNLYHYVRELIVINCTFSKSASLQLTYNSGNMMILNSTIREGKVIFVLISCNAEISINGTVLSFYDYNTLATYIFLDSNVTIMGDVTFADNVYTAIAAHWTILTLSGKISFLNNAGVSGGAMGLYLSTLNIASNTSVYFYNNSGVNGGAMALYLSTLNIAPNTSVYFYNNTASEIGGAIYVHNGAITGLPSCYINSLPCFYQLLDYDVNSSNWYNISFHNNSATKGGDHIYGALMHSSDCYLDPSMIPSCYVQRYFHYDNPKSVSAVSSDPIRICMCKNGSQQCHEYYRDIKVYPGETFNLSVVVVGADLGRTLGSVHAIFNNPKTTVQLKPSSQYIQGILNNEICSELNYTVFSQNKYEMLALTTKQESWSVVEQLLFTIDYYASAPNRCHHIKGYVGIELLYTPLGLNITLLPCPLGYQLRGDPPGCDCHPVLTENYVNCQFINHTGYLIWSGSLWLDILNDSDSDVRLVLAQYCPFDYCKSSEKTVNLQSDSSAQCAFNRAGRLCGDCRDGYSLAIGSSHCIQCPNNDNLALLIFFAATGFLLMVIIGTFNLTVTQGMINGLIFYANIVWTYQGILFSQEVESNFALAFLRTMMAWLNLDFGIQTCFVKGLNAIHKIWPQYFFILYIWGIAMAIILAANRSTKLTNLLGNRPVPILVTFFLLSYTKLFQTIIASVGFTQINVFGVDRNYTLTVWSLDGNYMYCHYPHVLLFIAALLVFLTIWLPYTLVLFSVKWLRKMSHLKLLKWVPKFNPIYDAHLAPLKDKHQYWFGVLLIVRGVLLVIFTLTYTVYPKISYIVLLITASLLLFYSNYHRLYKDRLVQLNESFFLFLLILISGTGILGEQTRRIIVYTSIGVGLLVFCGMIVGRLFGNCCKKGKIERDFVPANERRKLRQEVSDDAQYRDSILDETEPLLGDAEAIQDVATY